MTETKTTPEYIAVIRVTHGTKTWNNILHLYVHPRTVNAAYRKAESICREHNRSNTNGTEWEIFSIYTLCDISEYRKEDARHVAQ